MTSKHKLLPAQICPNNFYNIQAGGFLAEPKTEEQMEFLRGIAELEADFYGVQNWWIGLTDSGHEGRWAWAHSLDVGQSLVTGIESFSSGSKEYILGSKQPYKHFR